MGCAMRSIRRIAEMGLGLPKRWRGMAAVMVALALSASCEEARLGLDVERKILDIGNTAEPISLDPAKNQGIWEVNIIGNMFIGLTTEDAHSEVIPGMAEHWEVSPDGLTWTFFLRKANWSDGVPVTAYDFEFAMRRVLDPATLSEYAPILYLIKNAEAVNNAKLPPTALGVRAIDESTFEMKLEHPAAYLPGILKHQTAYPVPKHVVEQWGDEWIKPAHVVVNGAYTLVKWWSNYVVHLRKNPAFYDAANVCLNELFFYPTNDIDAATRRVQARELAWNTTFASTKVDELNRTLPGFVHAAPWLLMEYLSFNTLRPQFKDPRVRQALSMAVDRDFITEKVVGGGVKPSYQMVPANMPGYTKAGRLTWADLPQTEKRAQALKLLQEAGFGPNKPLHFTFEYRNSRDNPRIAVVLQSNWQSLAPWVKVELRQTEVQIHYANMRAKNFDVGDGGWVGDYPDAQTYLYLLETSSKSQNYPSYSNPVYDDLMERSSREGDPAVRADMLRQAEQVMLNDNPIIPLFSETSKNLVDPRITGWYDNLEDWHRARWMCIRSDAQAKNERQRGG
jgi:oligopeptide transport system substrate-binding protein